MPIGECAHCGLEIVAPHDIVVWVEGSSFHRTCYDLRVANDIAAQVSIRHTTPIVDVSGQRRTEPVAESA